ncbi:MAG: ABC transporter permease [Erysipelotrichaceae bacterium]|nr:ABC transporter permease [Erysipelotrichaceae bacterium]
MDSSYFPIIVKGIGETLYMVFASTIIGYIIGLPLGVVLTLTDAKGLKPNKIVYKILDVIVNIGRSIPFLILLILLMPFTRAIVGKSYGSTATIVPLTVSAIPFIARMVEQSLKEVDPGVIEAAQSMGASPAQIVIHVLMVEAKASLVLGTTIVFAAILGYSAMAGVIGGGGLGDIASRYGYYRREEVVMWVTVILLVALVQIFQSIGSLAAKKIDKRK